MRLGTNNSKPFQTKKSQFLADHLNSEFEMNLQNLTHFADLCERFEREHLAAAIGGNAAENKLSKV